MEFNLRQMSKKLLAALLAFLVIFSTLGSTNPAKAESILQSEEVGYASTTLYVNPDYKASVGEEIVAEDMAILSNADMIELIAEDGTAYKADEVIKGEFYFDKIPVGTYSPRLTQAAQDLGYRQDTPKGNETTITVHEGPSRTYRSSVSIWFSKKVENTTPTEPATDPTTDPSTEPTTDPATEQTTGSTTEQTTGLTTEQTTGSATEQTTEPTTQTTAQAATTQPTVTEKITLSTTTAKVEKIKQLHKPVK